MTIRIINELVIMLSLLVVGEVFDPENEAGTGIPINAPITPPVTPPVTAPVTETIPVLLPSQEIEPMPSISVSIPTLKPTASPININEQSGGGESGSGFTINGSRCLFLSFASILFLSLIF